MNGGEPLYGEKSPFPTAVELYLYLTLVGALA